MDERETPTPVPLNYASPLPPERRFRLGPWILFSAVGLALFVMFLLPEMGKPSERANRVKCAANLRAIGQALMLYNSDCSGRFPDNLAELLYADANAGQFVCPSGNDDRAEGPTTQAIIAELAKPGHCSYIYLGKGFTTKTCSAGTIIAYEPLSNHGKQGMNVLYGDGTVQWVNAQARRAMLAELAAGHNPPRPATMSAPAGVP